MSEVLKTDLCVIGAGSAGLIVAAGASQMGARTILIERDLMGGDCLNTGCVPSKSLLAAAKAAEAARRSSRFGVTVGDPEIDFAAVNDHVRSVIAAIEPNDSIERYEGLGVTVLRENARFVDRNRVAAGDRTIEAKRFVIATGSRPAVPPIEGLADTPYLTNETIFGLRQRPDHLVIIGGGPIGLEMAQAHRRLGSKVTVLEVARYLSKDDPEAVFVVCERLRREGVDLLEGIRITQVHGTESGVSLQLNNGETVEASHLLVATGRKPNVEDLSLEKAGVEVTPTGVSVDARLRTANRRIYAAGDVAGGPQFTHVAGYHAGIILRNALFRWPAKTRFEGLPWVTFTEPELAQVGLTEAKAREQFQEIRVLRHPFAENDRALAEGETDGFAKIITTKRGRVLGATIVGAHAGELIHLWALAITQRLKIGAVATMIAPYPTLGEISKRAAGNFYTGSLFSDRTRRLVRLLLRLG
ncbi:MAG: FAD-dependent oxidoreductase [Pseudomonadota bacterium]